MVEELQEREQLEEQELLARHLRKVHALIEADGLADYELLDLECSLNAFPKGSSQDGRTG